MITFHFSQPDCDRSARKNQNAGTFSFTPQIASSICTVTFTKREKSDAMLFTSRCSRWSLICNFRHGQALPLSRAEVLRLANGSPELVRSPARRSRDGRETSGKKSGKMSRVIFAQHPGNGGEVAAVMPLNVCQDDSQDNLQSCAIGTCSGRAGNLRDNPRDNRIAVRATTNATSCKRLVEFLPSVFNHNTPSL
jgi:hypothetical protein